MPGHSQLPARYLIEEGISPVQNLMTRIAGFGRSREPEKFHPDAVRDIFLVTYPRSGTTWISCVAAELLFQISPGSFTEVASIVPDVHALPDRSAVPEANQYIVKSHLPLTANRPFGEYRRI